MEVHVAYFNTKRHFQLHFKVYLMPTVNGLFDLKPITLIDIKHVSDSFEEIIATIAMTTGLHWTH